MTRCSLTFVSLAAVLSVCSCIVTPGEIGEGVTRTREEFMIRYRDIDVTYFSDVVEIESLIVDGKELYDDYFYKKDIRNQIDAAVRTYAIEKFSRACEKFKRLHSKTKANSLVILYSEEIRPYMEKLLKETEEPGKATRPGPGY